MPVALELAELSGEYAVCRLPANQALPDWVPGDGLVNVTFANDEISVVCLSQRVPAQTEYSAGWTAIRISSKFEFDQPGVVLAVVQPVSSAGLGIFVMSTFYRDYILVRTREITKVRTLLTDAGHHFTRDTLAPLG